MKLQSEIRSLVSYIAFMFEYYLAFLELHFHENV